MNYLWLAAAILSEVFATSSLKASNGFTRGLPSLFVVVGYGAAFYFLSQTLKTIPVGIAYAIWSGVGTVLIAVVGLLLLATRNKQAFFVPGARAGRITSPLIALTGA